MERPKVESKSSKSLSEYKFHGINWLLVLLNTVILIGAFLPYFIVLYRGTLHPFLPTISQAAGFPPQSGILNICITLWSILAFIGQNLIYMGIRIHVKRLNDDRDLYLASLLNNISLCCSILATVGAVFVGSFPIDSNISSDEWYKTTAVPHGTGAVCLFVGGMFYNLIMTYLLFLIHPERKQILRIRIFINCVTAISVVLMLITTKGVTDSLEYTNKLGRCIIEPDSVPYTLSYIISSVAEWCGFLTLIAFIATLKDEAKRICFTMTVTLDGESGDGEIDRKTPLIADHQEEKTVKQS